MHFYHLFSPLTIYKKHPKNFQETLYCHYLNRKITQENIFVPSPLMELMNKREAMLSDGVVPSPEGKKQACVIYPRQIHSVHHF